MLPYCFLLLFVADGLAKLCSPARELTEILFIMQLLWKMSYTFQTALQIEFWNTNRVLFHGRLFEKRYFGSRRGNGSQKHGAVRERLCGSRVPKSENLKGWEWWKGGRGNN